MKGKKTLFNRMIYGIKSGWNLPIYPDHIIALERKLYIRIFRFIGAICTFLQVSDLAKEIDYTIYLITLSISMPYLIYRLVLVFYAIKQWFHNLITGKFIVRNSTLDYFTTIFRVACSFRLFYLYINKKKNKKKKDRPPYL